jgi:hypothetical protein
MGTREAHPREAALWLLRWRSRSAYVVWILIPGMIALAPLWMIFFSGRRLKMSTDYAAVAAGAMAAILLIGVVEMHVLTSSASEMLQKRRSEWQEHLRELRQGESTSPPDNGLKHPLEVRAWGLGFYGS